jgi:uncharacterized membrane protein
MTSATTKISPPNIGMCVLSYLGLFSLIPYFVKKDDPFISWHAKQGLLIATVSIVTYFLLFVLSMIPFIGTIAMILNMLFGLTVLAVSLMCIVQACGGKRWAVPVLSQFLGEVPDTHKV